MQQGPNETRQQRFEEYGEDRVPYNQEGSASPARACPELVKEDPGARPPLPLETLKSLCDQHNIPHSILTAAILSKAPDLTDIEGATKWLIELNSYISGLSPLERLTPAISPLVSPWEFTSLSACLRRSEVLKDMRSAEGAEDSLVHLAAWWQLFKSFEGSELKPHAAEIAAGLTYLVVPNEEPPKSNATSELSGFVLRRRAATVKERFQPVNSNTAFPYRAKFVLGYNYLIIDKLAKMAPYLSDKKYGTGVIPLNKLLRIASSCGATKLLSALRTHDPKTIKQAVLEAEAARAAASSTKNRKNRNLQRRAILTEEKRSALKERTASEINKLETTLDNGCKSIRSARIPNETQSISALINNIKNEISTALKSANEPTHEVDVEVPSALKRGATELALESFWHQAKQALTALKKALNPDTQESVEIGAEQPSSSPPQTEPSVEEILLVERAKNISAALANEIGTEVPFTVETDLRSNLVVVIAHPRRSKIKQWSPRLTMIQRKLPPLGDFNLKIVPIAKHFSESSDDDRYIAANRAQRPSIRISEVADAAEYLRDALKLNYPNAWADVEHSGNTIVFRSQIKLSALERDAIAKLMKLIPVPILFEPPREERPVTFTSKSIKRLINALAPSYVYINASTIEESGAIKLKIVSCSEKIALFSETLTPLLEEIRKTNTEIKLVTQPIPQESGDWLSKRSSRVATKLADSLSPDGSIIYIPKAERERVFSKAPRRYNQGILNPHKLKLRHDIRPVAIDSQQTKMREGAISIQIVHGTLKIATHFFNAALLFDQFSNDRIVALRRALAFYDHKDFTSRLNSKFRGLGFSTRAFSPSVTTTYSIPISALNNLAQVQRYLENPNISLDMIKLDRADYFDNYPSKECGYPAAQHRNEQELLSLLARAFLSHQDQYGVTEHLNLTIQHIDSLLITLSNLALSRFVAGRGAQLLYTHSPDNDKNKTSLGAIVEATLQYLINRGISTRQIPTEIEALYQHPELLSKLITLQRYAPGLASVRFPLSPSLTLHSHKPDLFSGYHGYARFNTPQRSADALANQNQLNAVLGYNSPYCKGEMLEFRNFVSSAIYAKQKRLEEESLIRILEQLSNLDGAQVSVRVVQVDQDADGGIVISPQMTILSDYRCILICSDRVRQTITQGQTIWASPRGFSIKDNAVIFELGQASRAVESAPPLSSPAENLESDANTRFDS